MNRVNIEGTLTKDAEDKGESVRIRIVSTRSFKRADLTIGEDTTFLTVSGWRDVAQKLRGLKKGDSVAVEGRLRSYDVGEGDQKSARLEVEAHAVMVSQRSLA